MNEPTDPLHPPIEPGPLRTDLSSITNQDRTWAMIAHLLAFGGYFVPFGHILGPLIVWLVKKDQSFFVGDHARESLNFQITLTIALIACIPLVFVCVGWVLMAVICLLDVIFVTVAAVNASGGSFYRYPMTIRFIT